MFKNKLFAHPFKNKRRVQNCLLDPKQDKDAKVINTFLKILITEIGLQPSQDILKSDFMNNSMMVYTKRKTEIDTLARTHENLNYNDAFSKTNRSSRLSPKAKKFKQSKNSYDSYYSKGYSKPKDIVSRFRMSTLGIKKSEIIPAGISNVNKSLVSNMKKPSVNESIVSSKTKPGSKHKSHSHYKSTNRSANRSLQRYISSTEARINKSKHYMTGDGSRNNQFSKSKSISQNEKKFRFEAKTQNQFYSNIHKEGGSVKAGDDSLNRTQQLALNRSDYKDHQLKRIPSQQHDIEASKRNTDYYSNKAGYKRGGGSVSVSKVYRNKDSRHLSEQNRPLFLANMLNSTPGKEFNDSYLNNLEENKSINEDKDNFDLIKPKVQRSPSENHEK